jgi:hypothetical protein
MLNLSPIKLPFSGDISSADKQSFDGLFGVFNDSLPDGWGRLLLDRSLFAKGDWKFAPAYDLTFSYSGYGFHSTMIAGESKNPGRKELMKLATHFG